jgi:ubiquinone/menaquinone biosynthesis C-methylase UbiE
MEVPPFKDHFSRLAADYSRFRPAYPRELIEYVADCAPDRRVALDCATGNGQAAVALAAYFETVLAIDGSASQIARAQPHARVTYLCALAERLPVEDHSVSLIAAAQAVHWFDFARFYAECRRALAPQGVVAVWTYEKFRATADVDAVMDRFYCDVVGPYWPAERRYVDEGYRTLPFPLREEAPPPFSICTDWTLEQALGYVSTWSAVARYRDAHPAHDPLQDLAGQLGTHWPAAGTLRLVWPVHLRLGRA